MIKKLLQKAILISALASGLTTVDARADEPKPTTAETASMGDTTIASSHNFDLYTNPAGTAFDKSKGGLSISGGANHFIADINTLEHNFSVLSDLDSTGSLNEINQKLDSLKDAEILINLDPKLFLQLNIAPGYSGTISLSSISEAQFYTGFYPLHSSDLELDMKNQCLLIKKEGDMLSSSFKADLGIQIAYAFPIPLGPITLGTSIRTRHFKRFVNETNIRYPEKLTADLSIEDFHLENYESSDDYIRNIKTADGFSLDLATLIMLNDPLFNTNLGIVVNNVASNLKTEKGLMKENLYLDTGLSIHPLYWTLQLPSKNQDRYAKTINVLGFNDWELSIDLKYLGTEQPIFNAGAQFPLFDGHIIPKIGYLKQDKTETFTTGLSLKSKNFQLDFAYWHNDIDTYIFALTFGGGLI